MTFPTREEFIRAIEQERAYTAGGEQFWRETPVLST
jgi:hypothetical protein